MAALTVKGIRKRFNKVDALLDVDLHVDDGSFCVILGPSGCGKSTLLQIVAGLVPQDAGSVSIDGRCVDALSARERDVAMVFQSYALYPHMTVYENLGFGLRMRGVSREPLRKRVVETAELLGIQDLLDRKPRELSGGQRQRVAMGRALVRRPKLFLMDEPLSNLDALLRTSVRLELKALHEQIQGTTVYVTHDQVEAMTLGEKVVVMKEGRVRQTGRPEEIYNHPSDTFVATFIGTPQMNVLAGRLEAGSGGRRLFGGKGFSLVLDLEVPHPAGQTLEVGIRPEDVSLLERSEGDLQGTVLMISHVGADKYVHLRLGETQLTARVSKDRVLRPGDGVSLALPTSKLHFFHDGRRVAEVHPGS